MARKRNPEQLDTLYRAVENHPGKRPGFLARLLGWERSAVTRALPAMQEEGYLLAEDDRERLWPFDRPK